MKECPTCHQISLARARMGGWACTNEGCADYQVVKNLDPDDNGEGEGAG